MSSIKGYLDQKHELAGQQAALRALVAERDTIQTRLQQLANPAVIEARARELGYVMPGERPIRVTGLDRLRQPQPPRHDGGGFWSWLTGIF